MVHTNILSNPKTLYIFIDESGDLHFSSKNSKNFYMGALVTNTISREIIYEMYNIRHKHLTSEVLYKSKQDKDLEYFHATEDLQGVRNDIFSMLERQSIDILGFYSVYTQKNKANPIFHEKIDTYYVKHVIWLINSILHNENIESYENIMIFFDGMPISKNKKAMFKGIKVELSAFFSEKGIKIPYYIYSHQSKSHHYLQIADYMNWAINVSKERGEIRPIGYIKKFIKNIWNPFERGTREYY